MGGCRSRKLRAHILNYKHEGWGIGGEERRREGKREMEGGKRREGRMERGGRYSRVLKLKLQPQ